MSVPVNEGLAPSPSPPVKPKVSNLRNLLGVGLLVVFSAVAIIEWRAGLKATMACSTLEGAIKKDPLKKITQQEAEAMIGRSPDPAPAPTTRLYRVTYSWQGALRRHSFQAEYRNETPPFLISVYAN